MKNNIALGLVLTSLLFLVGFATLRVQQTKAQPPQVFPLDPPARIYVDPPIIRDPLGRTVNVSVYVNSSTDLNLYGWQIRLQWDPTILNYTKFTGFWGSSTAVNSTTGQLLSGSASPFGINVTLFNVSSALPSKVLTVTFQGLAYGISSINVTSFALMGRSDTGNGWTSGMDPYNDISEFTQYDRWPDVDGDGSIGIVDALLLSSSYYSTEGDANYWSACDFNNDSAVDNFDRAILSSDFSKNVGSSTWPNSTYPTGLTNTIYVFNETIENGSVRVVIPGDVNGDGAANILDGIRISNAWNATPTSLNWDPDADINGDDAVNILDAITLSNHWLQHYP